MQAWRRWKDDIYDQKEPGPGAFVFSVRLGACKSIGMAQVDVDGVVS